MSEKINICDKGVENLIQGIIGQAVNDYVNARLHIDDLNDRNTSIVKAIREDTIRYESAKKKRKKRLAADGAGKKRELPPLKYKINTLEDAEKEVDFLIRKEQQRVNEVIRFFEGDHYASMCDIDGKKMLKFTEAKYQEAYNEIHKDDAETEESVENCEKVLQNVENCENV